MRRTFRAVALSAAAITLCAAGGLSAPSFASQAELVPVAAYTDHEGARLTAESLGLNDLTDPALPADGFDTQAPIARHAVAPALPPRGLDLDEDTAPERSNRSLADLVAEHGGTETPDAQTECLARAVYWESKGEPLAGQLSVAEVIINRARSGRFASTICGVVRQRGQFSFVRGGVIPAAREGSRDWRVAVAIAHIAQQDLADGGAPNALFFHARRARPGWRLTRVATVGNHVFYR